MIAGPDSRREEETSSYNFGLIRMTRIGSKCAAIFFLIFALIYWMGRYPPTAVWVNLAAMLCSVAAAFLLAQFHRHGVAAHLVTFAIYVSSAGMMAISDGIHSSSVIWQIFIPVAAFIMAGRWAGLVWGGISLLTITGFYLLDLTGTINAIVEFRTTTQDLVIDLTISVISVSMAIWFSDSLKSRAMSHLQTTRDELNVFATTDPLTHILNRRHFFERTEMQIVKSRNEGAVVAFLLVDIDHFKRINDLHGHTVGDQILIGLVGNCLKNLRTHDIMGRFGGEEFLILLPKTDLDAACRIAERLLDRIDQTPIVTDAGPIQITVSIGISATEPGRDLAADQLFSRADQAMYRAKQAGRNRIQVWQDSAATS